MKHYVQLLGGLGRASNNEGDERRTKTQTSAAVLLRAYRHRISRRRDTITKFRFSPELTRLFDRCLEEAQRMKWPSKHIFRKIYLGALPHILFCLEKALEGVTAAKSEVKERFNVAEHLELEELGKRQTELA